MPTTLSTFEESLGYVVSRAGRAMANRLNHNFEKAGHSVTCEQWAILMNLWKKNGQTQKDLAGCTCKNKASITRLIDGMEKHQLVIRKSDPKDGRKKYIYLTAKGQDLQHKLLRQIDKTHLEAEKDISEKELQLCKAILKRVTLNLT